MKIKGHGIDIVEIERFSQLCESPRYLNRCFTEREQIHSKGQADRFAARFAAKEAVLKALKLGLADGVSLKDVEISFLDDGSPTVILRGAVLRRADSIGISEWHLSFSHGQLFAVASAIAV